MNPSQLLTLVMLLFIPVDFCFATSIDATWNPNFAPTANGTLVKKNKKKKATEKRNMSLLVPTFVVHGAQPGQQASDAMPGKIDGNGNMVITPGVGLQYKGDNGFLLIGAIVKDCYNDLAGTLQFGRYFELGKTTEWGITMGVYARQTPLSCTYDNFGNKSCISLDNYPYKFSTSINNQPVDIIPMPFLTFSTALYKDNDVEIDFKVMGNIVLNEVGFSVPF